MPIVAGPGGPGVTTTSPAGSTGDDQSIGQSASSGNASTQYQIGANIANNQGQYSYYPQQLFDSRITALTFPMGGGGDSSDKITRGFMIWATAAGAGSPFGGTRASFNFLYNPTTVTASYSIAYNEVTGAVLTRQAGDTASPTAPTNNVISISLLFDRTFELWNGYAPAPQGSATANNQSSDGTVFPSDPTVYGVGADVFALEQLCGMTVESAPNNTPSTGKGTAISPLLGVQGLMFMIPTWMFLGNEDGGLSYYGFVQDFTVTYTHFTQYMVPMRCTIDLDFTLLPQYATTNSSGFAGSNQANAAWSTAQLGQNTGTAGSNSSAFNGDSNITGPTNGIF